MEPTKIILNFGTEEKIALTKIANEHGLMLGPYVRFILMDILKIQKEHEGIKSPTALNSKNLQGKNEAAI